MKKGISRIERSKSFDDSELGVIILDKQGEQVLGLIKSNLALLIEVPNPKTSYYLEDIVEVIGPTGNQRLRDDFVPEYKALKVYEKSNIQTFTFRIISEQEITAGDFFHIQGNFKSERQNFQLLDFFGKRNVKQVFGWCSATSVEQAKNILKSSTEEIPGIQIIFD